MWAKRIQYLNENFSRIAKRDRIFLNNPVIMSGLGLAPLVVVATNGTNALMLSVAVLLMLTPTRVLASFVSRWIRFRALAYCLCAAVVYMAAYQCMRQWFDVQVVLLGICPCWWWNPSSSSAMSGPPPKNGSLPCARAC